jgi:flagellar hook protein FlgE
MVANGSDVSYTRDGSFSLDTNGNLVQNSTGERLLGWQADSQGVINTNTPLTGSNLLSIPIGALSAAQATSTITMNGNLSSQAASTDTWTTQTTVYDKQGSPHSVTIEFSNPTAPPAAGAPTGATESWNWTAFEGGTTGTVLGSSSSTGNAPLYFDSSGNIMNPSTTGAISVASTTGGTSNAMSLDFSHISQLDTASQVAVSAQDGFPPGTLQSYAIDVNGVITGTFSNGLSRQLGQVALANFANPDGLTREGNNLWKPSNNTGAPQVGTPKTTGLGSISAGYLEQSNVDISSQFTNMIVTQRGFEANTKVVTTVDQMLQDLIGMIR